MRKLGRSSVRILAVALVGVAATGFGVETYGQDTGPKMTALKPAHCVKRVEPVNDDGSLLKPELLLNLERRYAAAPDDVTVEKELTEVLFDLAQHMMWCSEIEPKRKYPLAYCLYGRVLELDESNKAAQEGREMIESIYKSLGKSRPECDCR